jgi:beta-lactamase class D
MKENTSMILRKFAFFCVICVLKRLTIMSLAANCYSNQPQELPGLKKVFDNYKVDGSILIYSQHENVYMGYNLERCNIAFCPASTFKIPNTLIALETGISTAETVFQWNGEKRTFPYFFATNVAPNKDTDLNTFSQTRIELTKEVMQELKIISED